MNDNNTKDVAVVEGTFMEMAKVDPLEAMQRCENLFQKRLALAIQATTSRDWIAQGDKPYLQETGAQKVAARFGICLGDMEIERENIDDERGRYYVYSVKGTATWPATGRTIQEIGSCSSRDAFFGKNKATEDVDIGNIKKAAVTNFMGRAILKILGLGGLEWADLEKFNITPKGKTAVNYKGKAEKATETKTSQKAESSSKKPYWESDYNETVYICARVGKHFSEEFLANLGMKKSQKSAGLYSCAKTPDIENALNEEFVAAEEQLAVQQDGGVA